MTAALFSDAEPIFEPRGDNMLITFGTDRDAVRIAVPRHAFVLLIRNGARALGDWFPDGGTAEIINLRAARKARKRENRA